MEKIDIAEQRIADMSEDLLKILLSDKTTGSSIVWATDNYAYRSDLYAPNQHITPGLITGVNTHVIQPRVSKDRDEQIRRTRDKAEVFTSSWICNLQNNSIDDAWFGKPGTFNTTEGTTWTVNETKVEFPDGKSWMDYVDERRLEITCGEAPYLVSRYDTVTGKELPIKERIGLLDRKLRVVNENVESDEEWSKWVTRAFQSCYGFDYQGDNVLLARENLLLTYFDYYEERYSTKPSLRDTKKIATIIAWNIWQMDGLTNTVPFSDAPVINNQISLYDAFGEGEEQKIETAPIKCKVFDWRSNCSLEFDSIGGRP